MAAPKQRKSQKNIEKQKAKQKAAERRRLLLTGAGVAALVIVLAGAVFIARGVKTGGADITATQAAYAGEIDPIKGSKDAAVTIQEFADFQCPSCKSAQPIINQLFMEFGDQIKFEFENFPLPSHEWAMPTAVAGECILEQSQLKFWKFSDLMYERQEEWSKFSNDDFVAEYAKEIGADMNTYNACAGSPEAAKKVENDMKEGNALNVNSTPTFFVNGERFVGGSYPELSEMVKDAMAKSKP